MSHWRGWALALLLGLSPLMAQELDPATEQRYQKMLAELRCVVCQNQTIAESNAPLAQDLREQVRKQIAAGRSDAEIRQYLVERYSDFVLYRPPLRPRTLLLWFGPALLLLLGLALAIRFSRASRKPVTVPAADDEALRRLLDKHS